MSALVVAADPGLAAFGLAGVRTNGLEHAVETVRVIETVTYVGKYQAAAIGDLNRRAGELARALRAELAGLAPDVVVAEEFSYPPDKRAAAMLAMSWGVFLTVLDELALPLACARPGEWRSSLIGPTPKMPRTVNRRKIIEAREARAHAEVHRRLPNARRILEANVPRALRVHVNDALGVFCWGVHTNLVRTAARRR